MSRLAATYLAQDTQIAPVLRELFASAEFAGSIGAKMWRPFEQLVSVARLLGLRPDTDGVEGPWAWCGWPRRRAQPVRGTLPDRLPRCGGRVAVHVEHVEPVERLAEHRGRLVAHRVRPADIAACGGGRHVAGDTWGAGRHGGDHPVPGAPVAAAHRSALLTFLNRSAGDVLRADSAAISGGCRTWSR